MGKAQHFWSMSTSDHFFVEAEDRDWAWSQRVRLRSGRKARDWPDPPPRYRVHDKYRKVNDFPSDPSGNTIMSNKLRAFLDLEAPGAAQFLPIRLTGGDSPLEPYWVVNWLSVIDCLHEQSYAEDEKGRFVQVPIIDMDRVTPDTTIGIVKDYLWMIVVRNDVRLRMMKAGVKGIGFERTAHSDGTNFVPFIRPDYSSKSKGDKAPSRAKSSGSKKSRGKLA